MSSLHRIILYRLLAAWVVISLLIGVAVSWTGLRRIDRQLVALATTELRKFADANMSLQRQMRPQRRFTRCWFQYRIVLGISQRLRQRASLVEGLFDHGVVGGFESQVEFEPGHGGGVRAKVRH